METRKIPVTIVKVLFIFTFAFAFQLSATAGELTNIIWSSQPPASLPKGTGCSCALVEGAQATYQPHAPFPIGTKGTVINNCPTSISTFVIQDTALQSAKISPGSPAPGRRFGTAMIMPGQSLSIDDAGVIASFAWMTSCPSNKEPTGAEVFNMKWSVQPPERLDGPAVFCQCAVVEYPSPPDGAAPPHAPYPNDARASIANQCNFPISIFAQQDISPQSFPTPPLTAADGRRFGQVTLAPGQKVQVDLAGRVADTLMFTSCPIAAPPTCDICDLMLRPICSGTYGVYYERLLRNHGIAPDPANKMASARVALLFNQCTAEKTAYAKAHLSEWLKPPEQTDKDYSSQLIAVGIVLDHMKETLKSVIPSQLEDIKNSGDKWFTDEVHDPNIGEAYCAIANKINNGCGWIYLATPAPYLRIIPNWTISCDSPLNGSISSSCQWHPTYTLQYPDPGYSICRYGYHTFRVHNGRVAISPNLDIPQTRLSFAIESHGDSVSLGGGSISMTLDYVAIVPSIFTQQERDKIGCDLLHPDASGPNGGPTPPKCVCQSEDITNPQAGVYVCETYLGTTFIDGPCAIGTISTP